MSIGLRACCSCARLWLGSCVGAAAAEGKGEGE